MFKKSFSLCLLVFLCLLMFCPLVSQTYAADMYLNPTAGYPIMGDSTAAGNVMTLKATGNVGIGTTNPVTILQVGPTNAGQNGYDGVVFQATADDAMGARYQGIRGDSWRTSGTGIGVNGTAAGVGAATNIGLYGWSTGATNNYGLWIDRGNSYFYGSVGIGEAVPGSKLAVSGGASIGASYDTIASPSNGMIIEGYVGIGTTGPGYALDVNGTIRGTGLITPYAQTITVAKSGGDYTTITAALNAITDAATDKRYLIKVMPGTYSEAITGKSFVDIVSAGGKNVTIITQADATVVTLANDELIQGFSITLTAPSVARNVIAYPGGINQQNNWILDSDITFSGNYDSYGIGVTHLSSRNINGLYIDNCVITGTSASYGYGIQLGGNSAAVTKLYITNNKISNVKYGIYQYFGATANTSYSIIKNNYVVAGTYGLYQGYVVSGYNIAYSYNNYYSSNAYLTSVTAGNTTLLYSYGDVLPGVIKSASGGTETAYIYGSVVNSSLHTPSISGGLLANDSITIQGTTNATRTTSYVNLQPNGGNVGIGTVAPVTKLHVGAKVVDDNGFSYDSNSLMAVHQTSTATATLNDPKTVLFLARQGTNSQAYGAAATFNLSRYENAGTNSRTRMDISLANASFDPTSNNVMTLLSSGNVGIGTTAPVNKLHVQGTGAGSAGIYLNDAVPGTATATLYNSGGDLYWAGSNLSSGSNPWTLSGSDIYRSTGNVGIGTVGPGNKLQINAASATASESLLRLSGGATGFSLTNDAGTAYSLVFDGCAYSGPSGIVQRDGAKIEMAKENTWNEAMGGVGVRGALVFYTGSGSIASPTLTEKVRIQSSGNVGIGTTGPGAKLQVVGSTADTTAAGLNITDSASVSRLYVRNDGNVGIGTTDPGSYRLYVNGGDAYFSNDVSALSFTDRTPYPKDLQTAYDVVKSMQRLPEGEYDENDKEYQLDHSKLHEFIKSSDGEHRDLSAVVSAQNEVIKDLLKRIEELEARLN